MPRTKPSEVLSDAVAVYTAERGHPPASIAVGKAFARELHEELAAVPGRVPSQDEFLAAVEAGEFVVGECRLAANWTGA